ncbi:hypothetical protein Micbo1qcDRAFT_177144 [Microdochium bolleyi]|uniref:Uncharacterized protein n=1 Tax=Microdochium bolleyi TaxID=196109 RepID=A0A136IWP2_9PEZI|nr:hypothetical protein Micbo1qcDRAFT_177144 [Microdochium bolleyi]
MSDALEGAVFYYPEWEWAENIDFLIMVVRRRSSKNHERNPVLYGTLDCFQTEEHATTEAYVSRTAARQASQHLDVDIRRRPREFTVRGKAIPTAWSESLGLGKPPKGKKDYLWVFRAVVPSGVWAFYLSREPFPIYREVDTHRVSVIVCSGRDELWCNEKYHGSTYYALRALVLSRRGLRNFEAELNDWMTYDIPGGGAGGAPAGRVIR